MLQSFSIRLATHQPQILLGLASLSIPMVPWTRQDSGTSNEDPPAKRPRVEISSPWDLRGKSWRYSSSNQVYVKRWSADYTDWWFEHGYWYQVRWVLMSFDPKLDENDKRVIDETWEWHYTGRYIAH